MNFAFGITIDDVIVAVRSLRDVRINDETATLWLDQLDHDDVEDVALYGDTDDEQIEIAHAEIVRQLCELGLLS